MARSIKKGPFVDDHLHEEGGRGCSGPEVEEGDQDLVAALDHHPRVRRAHLRGAQRPQVHPGVRHREHGRSQARRVRADAHLPRPLGRPQGGGRWRRHGNPAHASKRCSERRRAMARAVSRRFRASPRKVRVVADLIRGKTVGRGADDPAHSQRKAAAHAGRKLLDSRDRQRRPRTRRSTLDTLFVKPGRSSTAARSHEALDAARDGPRQPRSTSAPAT